MDARFRRRCSKCGHHKSMKGGRTIGGWTGRFVCADCKEFARKGIDERRR